MQGSSDTEPKKRSRGLSSTHYNQIQVLRCLSATSPESGQPRAFTIPEITQSVGIEDEKETQRYLFILEGQKLVSPQPPGDFTSKLWQITREGQDALKLINSAPMP